MAESNDDKLLWRIGARTPGHDYRIFHTAFVDAQHPETGDVKRFSLIEAGDWVNVIALTPRDEVVLVRQYRAGTGTVGLEIPGGMVDPGEDALEAAKRELAEETGYTSRTWSRLGRVSPNPAIQTNRLHVYLALDATQTSPPHPEGSEVLALELLPLATVQQLLRDGTIEHALVVAAFGYLAFEGAALRRP